MKQINIAFRLKCICIAFAIAGLLFFFLVLPFIAGAAYQDSDQYAPLLVPGLAAAYLIGVLCYLILFQFWKVSINIGKNLSFCLENSNAFVWMSRYSMLIFVLCLIFLIYTFIQKLLFSGVLLLNLILLFLGMALAVLTSALSHLIENAYELKEENDLTI